VVRTPAPHRENPSWAVSWNGARTTPQGSPGGCRPRRRSWAAYAVIVALLCVMVRRRFLFRIIPT
jgi:hypothetical protein